ncbi:MAG: M15 family metallopeptidase [Culicoidibacterales bacterium]
MKNRKKQRKQKKQKKLIVSLIVVMIILLVLNLFFLGRVIGTSQEVLRPEISEPVSETTSPSAEIPKQVELTAAKKQKLLNYTKSFQTLSRRDISGYGDENQSEINALKQEINDLLVNNKTTELEKKLNKLAYSLDKPDIIGGDGDLYYLLGVLLVNKQYCLPANFRPGESALAREAFNQMAVAAKQENINLYDFSTYRNYDTQKKLYDRYVATDGQENADRYSAKPGCSEHQTGLVFDIGGDNKALWAETTFDETKEAIWLANNAYRYGYILRYPQGGEKITGYMHESWHYRYIGELSEEFQKSGIKTLEEFLQT